MACNFVSRSTTTWLLRVDFVELCVLDYDDDESDDHIVVVVVHVLFCM